MATELKNSSSITRNTSTEGEITLEVVDARQTLIYSGTSYPPRRTEYAFFVGGGLDPSQTVANGVVDGDTWVSPDGTMRTRILGDWAPPMIS